MSVAECGGVTLLTDTRLLRASTTALNPGCFRTRSLSSSSTCPKSFPVSCTRRVMSAKYVNAVPSAGRIVVIEKEEWALLGNEEEGKLMIYRKQRWVRDNGLEHPGYRPAEGLESAQEWRRTTHDGCEATGVGELRDLLQHRYHRSMTYPSSAPHQLLVSSSSAPRQSRSSAESTHLARSTRAAYP
jgi:hypothetical protein